MFNCASNLRVEKSPFQLLSTASAAFDSQLIILSKSSSGKVSTPTPCRLLQLHSRDDCAIYSRRSSGKLHFNSLRMLQLLRLQLHHLFEANSTTLSKASSGKAPLVCRLLQLLSSRHHQLLTKSFEWKLLHFNYSSPLQCPSRVSDVFQLFANTASSTRVDSLRMLSLQSSNLFVNSIHVLAVWRR